MSTRATIVLAVLVGLVALLVQREWLPSAAPSNHASAPPQATDTGRLLLDFERAQVESVILSAGDRRLEVQRQAGQWTDPARGRLIDSLVDDLWGLRTLDIVAAQPTDLSEFGLDKPRSRIEIKLRDRAPVVLNLGEHNPTVTAVYLRFADDGPIYLAGSLVIWKIETALKQAR